MPANSVRLIHGTWGRGLIPLLKGGKGRAARWCSAEHPFYRRLERHLARSGIDAEVSTFNWTGSNSFRERNRAAERLADILSAEYAATPLRRTLLVGHSHGGNIALRCLEILKSRENGCIGRVSIATIATPFVTLERPNISNSRKHLISWTIVCIFLGSIYSVTNEESYYFDSLSEMGALNFFALSLAFLLVIPLIISIASGAKFTNSKDNTFIDIVPMNSVYDITEISKYRETSALGEMLVLRGSDDEAALALSAGSLGTRIMDLSSGIVRLIGEIIAPFYFLSVITIFALIVFLEFDIDIPLNMLSLPILSIGVTLLLGVISSGVLRSVFGRELLLGGMFFDAISNSVPDSKGCLEIRTLSRGGSKGNMLRHSLYNHPMCAYFIVRWWKACCA